MSNVIRNTVIYAIGNILPQAAAFILLPVYASYLSPGDYGIIESVNALNPILVIFFSLCFGAAIFRLFHEYKTEAEQREFFGTIFISTIVFSSAFLLLILLFNKAFQQIYRSIDFFPYFFYMTLTVFVSTFFDLPQKYLMLKNQSLAYIGLSLVNFTVTSLLILFFLTQRNGGASGYLLAGLIGALLILPAYLYLTLRIIKFRFSYQVFKNLISFSLPIIPTMIAAWVLNLSDRIFIERYFSITDVGIYSLAFKISTTVLIVVTSFDMAYRPIFFKLANDPDIEQGKHTIYKYNYFFLLLFLLATFIASFFSKEVIQILFDERYKDASRYIPLITVSFFFSVSTSLLARFFEQSKKMKANMTIALGMAVLNFALNFILIPFLGIYGAIFATMIAFLAGTCTAYFYARKYCFFVPFQWKKLIPVAALLIGLVLYFQYFTHSENIVTMLIIKSVIALLVVSVLLHKHYKEIKKIFVNKPVKTN